MNLQNFQQRNLSLDHPWKWLLNEFAYEYGVSDAYTKLRYLCYIMELATATADCLALVYDLLLPVMHIKSTLSHQVNRILGMIEVQIKQMLARVFNNYKSLDEQSLSGIIIEEFRNATGLVAPVLVPTVQIYTLINDILSPEARNKLYGYFQDAAKDCCRRHITDISMYISGKGQSSQMDHFFLFIHLVSFIPTVVHSR